MQCLNRNICDRIKIQIIVIVRYDDREGVLQAHRAPKNLYSGLGNDTIGPAYYEPTPLTSQVIADLQGSLPHTGHTSSSEMLRERFDCDVYYLQRT